MAQGAHGRILLLKDYIHSLYKSYSEKLKEGLERKGLGKQSVQNPREFFRARLMENLPG